MGMPHPALLSLDCQKEFLIGKNKGHGGMGKGESPEAEGWEV